MSDNYLKALRDKDAEAIENLTCSSESNSYGNVALEIDSWEFIGQYQQNYDRLAPYVTVLVKIRYEGIASPVENLFELAVWETEDLYQYKLREIEKDNRANEDSTEGSLSEAPSREDFTTRKYCVERFRRS